MSKAPYTSKTWIAARKDYSDGLTISEIAKKRRVKLENIIKAVKVQGWTRKSDIVRTRKKQIRLERTRKLQEEIKKKKEASDLPDPEVEKPSEKEPIKDENLIERFKSRTPHRTKPVEEQGVEDGMQLVTTGPAPPLKERVETPDYVNSDHLLIFRKLRKALRDQITEYQAGSELMVSFAGDRLAQLLVEASESGNYEDVAKHNHSALQAFGQRAKMLQSLTNTAIAVTAQEREILGLSDEMGGDGQAEELLEALQAEFKEEPLPDNVLNYDQKARQLRQQGKLG